MTGAAVAIGAAPVAAVEAELLTEAAAELADEAREEAAL